MKSRSTLTVVLAICLFAALGGAVARGELILNGDMETNSGTGGDLANWTKITNSFGAWDGVAHSGGWVMHAGASFGAGGEFQDIATVVGQPYELSFWAVGFISGADVQQGKVQVGTPGSDDTDLELENNAEYVDVTFDVPLHTGPQDWQEFTHTFTPTTATTRVTFENIFLGDGQGAINVDDVSVVPEPGTAMLLAGGALVLLLPMFRRRRVRR